MDSWKEKIQQIKLVIIKKVHDSSFWKRFGAVTGIAAAAGLVISLFLARVTTVNDMIIRYTEPVTEELETEGFEEEIAETPEEELSEVPPEEEPPTEEPPVETPAEELTEQTPTEEPTEETLAEESTEEPSAEEPEETSVEGQSEEPPESETEPETPVMTYIPEVQVKFPMLSTTHRPWILSDLSDMFHSLSVPK